MKMIFRYHSNATHWNIMTSYFMRHFTDTVTAIMKVGTRDRDDYLKLERRNWEKGHFLPKSYHVISVGNNVGNPLIFLISQCGIIQYRTRISSPKMRALASHASACDANALACARITCECAHSHRMRSHRIRSHRMRSHRLRMRACASITDVKDGHITYANALASHALASHALASCANARMCEHNVRAYNVSECQHDAC